MQYRKVALIILYKKAEQKILMQHREEDRKLRPGYWAFFGGRIEEGEESRDAVAREAQEELTYHLKDPQLVLSAPFESPDIQIKGEKHVFIEEYDESKELELHEGQGMEWLTIDEAMKRKVSETDKELLQYLQGHLF